MSIPTIPLTRAVTYLNRASEKRVEADIDLAIAVYTVESSGYASLPLGCACLQDLARTTGFTVGLLQRLLDLVNFYFNEVGVDPRVVPNFNWRHMQVLFDLYNRGVPIRSIRPMFSKAVSAGTAGAFDSMLEVLEAKARIQAKTPTPQNARLALKADVTRFINSFERAQTQGVIPKSKALTALLRFGFIPLLRAFRKTL